MSQLNDKINSYALERGIEFIDTPSITPTRTGSNPLGTYTKSTAGIILEPSTGPVGGSGSWNMAVSTVTANNAFLRATTASTTELAGAGDSDYSVGIWFKINGFPTGTSATALSLFTFGAVSANAGFGVFITGSTHATQPSKIQVQFVGTQNYITDTLSTGVWYYLAVTRIGDAANNIKIYLNGALKLTKSNSNVTAPAILTFGSSSAGVFNNSFNISNYYQAPTSQINATEIGEIWTAGSQLGTNVSITETPATASALQIEPTIAVAAGDHTEITTSILVSSEMINPASVIAEINFAHTETIIDVTATLADVIDISTGNDLSHAAEVMTASALMTDAVSGYEPMLASAQSGDHSAYVTPNYYSKVKALNPYVYFYDGKTSSTSVNSGYQPVTFSVGSNVYTAQDGGLPLSIIGEGDSWFLRNTNNSPHQISITAPNTAASFDNKVGSGNFSVEFWIKPSFEFTSEVTGIDNLRLFVSEGLTVNRYSNGSVGTGKNGISVDLKINPSGSRMTLAGAFDKLNQNVWHHVVVQSALQSNGNVALQVFIDGASVLTGSNAFTTWTPGTNATLVFGGTDNDLHVGNVYLDEIALYDAAMSNSTIIDHYQFINTASPNRTILPTTLTASSQFANALFSVIANVNYPQSFAGSNALIVNPAVIPSRTIDVQAEPMEASVVVNDATLQLGWTAYGDVAIAYAESVNAFRLKTVYSNYVQTNIAPYRYVTFDGNNSYADYGTDNDYAVASTVVGGTIVNPDLGINGKSALTAGMSYVTDGVILKESEWDDTWGTGLNNYHSSFWIQKSANDNSTGLRVIWNLNGHYDNQHVILYQYQGKLHLNFNNGSGTSISQATVANYDLFDGERHFVAVAFDHTGANSYVNLFVDAVDVMTVNLGTYNGTTVNGIVSVPANDEANNHPRLSVGCLITPFESTSLPVQPTNTKIIADEILWAKSSLTQTLATNLFNVMPAKGDIDVFATPIAVTALMTTPSIITNSILSVERFIATAELVEPLVTADGEAIIDADIMTATAVLENAMRVNNVNIVSDIFMASASFGDAGAKITIPGGPMLATVDIARNITPKSPVSIYMKYLISKTLVTQQKLREVK